MRSSERTDASSAGTAEATDGAHGTAGVRATTAAMTPPATEQSLCQVLILTNESKH